MSKQKEVSPEENVITPEEFEALEKKEGRKPVKADKGKKEEKARDFSGASDFDRIILKTEKLEGKLDAVVAEKQALGERMSTLNEEIGELRSSILERDKGLNEIETGFRKIRDEVEGVSPKKIMASLAKGKEETELINSRIEMLEVKGKGIEDKVKEMQVMLSKIRDITNLVNMIDSMKKKIDKVEEDKKYTSRLAGKIEAMFSELSGKISEFDRYKDKISLNEDTMHEIMKSVDLIDIKLEQSVKKDDISRVEDEFAKRIEALKVQWDDRLYEIKRVVDELLESLKNAGVKGMLEKVGKIKLERAFASKDEIDEIKASLNELRGLSEEIRSIKRKQFTEAGAQPVQASEPGMPSRAPAKENGIQGGDEALERIDSLKKEMMVLGGGISETAKEMKAIKNEVGSIQKAAQEMKVGVEKQVEMNKEVMEGMKSVDALSGQMDVLINQAGEAVRVGQVDVAKAKYREALSIYNQLSQATTPEEAEQLYENIRKLYNRLRIYG